MKYLTLVATIILGFSNTLSAQINLEEESTKGTILEVSEGMTLVYGMNYFGNEFDVTFKIKSLNQQVVFDYETLNEKNNKGTLTMGKEALEIARAQDNYYQGEEKIDLQTQTSIWVSKLVFNELISVGEVAISTDRGATQVTLQGVKAGHDGDITNTTTNTEITDLSYVYAESADGKVKYWISLSEEKPVILKMEMGWSIRLKEIRTGE